MTEWDHKDEWRKRGKDFLVMVSRHTVKRMESFSGCFDEEGENRWVIYAYFYPKHPHFKKFDGDDMHQDAASLGMHGGCTFFRRHVNDGAVTSIQVGCDYNHLHDWQYTQYSRPDEARSIFADADSLFEKLQNMTEQPQEEKA